LDESDNGAIDEPDVSDADALAGKPYMPNMYADF
jgi:hypothetical protein